MSIPVSRAAIQAPMTGVKLMKSLYIATALAAVLGAAAAMAQDVRLKYADLDLSQPTAARTLKQRIDTAAERWCAAEAPMTGTLIRDSGCARRVGDSLVASLPKPTQQAYAAGLSASANQVASAARR